MQRFRRLAFNLFIPFVMYVAHQSLYLSLKQVTNISTIQLTYDCRPLKQDVLHVQANVQWKTSLMAKWPLQVLSVWA